MAILPTGKSIFIWKLSGDMIALAAMLREAGFRQAMVKIADGEVDFNAELLPAAIDAFRKNEIDTWGWQYMYGGGKYTGRSIASIEADAVIRNVNKYDLAGFLMDPEEYYKRPAADSWARTYTQKLRASCPNLSIGLCSYRYPSKHPELPWQTLLSIANFHAPQVYWIQANNPAQQLVQSITELTVLARLPVIPVGSAYFEHGWQPRISELDEFNDQAKNMKLPGVAWWCWDDKGLSTHPEYYETIRAHIWDAGTTPPPAPVTIGERLTAVESFLKTKFGYPK